jgi:ribosomal protein S18 acetylase RimI-like enzyme
MIRIYQLLKELREDLNYDEFLLRYQMAKEANGYEFIYLEENNEIVALLGYRILVDFLHGRHLYIDDLVTQETHRSKGLGAKLLKMSEEIAREKKCNIIRLCTGIANEQGKNFYEKNRMSLRAVVYKKYL